MLDTLRIAVTGGAGFIGSHLVRRLVEMGFAVTVLDNLSTGSLRNLNDVLRDIDFVRGDVTNLDDVEKAISSSDVVVHLAALIDVGESVEKPELYFDVNVKGTFNIARASRKADALIFASSSAVYGEPIKIPISEDHPLSPRSPYAASKMAGEAYVNCFAEINEYRPVVLRLFNVYGPKQSRAYSGVIVEFIKKALRGEPPVIFGDGEQIRDFIHVSDVVKAVINAITNSSVTGTFNIGSGEGVTINKLALLVAEIAGRRELRPIYSLPRKGDIRVSIADITKARRELGFNPTVSLEDGLRELVRYYSAHGFQVI